jgi:uncharacterized membrane protein YhiD involved in acid resistance
MNQLFESIRAGVPSAPDVALRLILAAVSGGLIAAVYRGTRPVVEESSFPKTLVFLAILIAMVTQVVGDNIARAFSLVGALSIVRFRTVVRDTEDTAYVMFAVIVGMAVGAGTLWVAGLGMAIVAVAALVMRGRSSAPAAARYRVTVRVAADVDPAAAVEPALRRRADLVRVERAATARQGLATDMTYELRLRPDAELRALIRELNVIDGVQGVEFTTIAEG